MHCINCGVVVVPAGANFCYNCGAVLRADAQSSPPSPASQLSHILETCEVAVVQGSLNKGFFQANAHGPDQHYIAGKSEEFSMLSSSTFWLDQQQAHSVHDQLVARLQAEGWEKLGTSSSDWWSTTLRRSMRG